MLADITRFNLQRLGLTIKLAKSGTEAIEWLRSNRPTLLITDFQMPGASGEDVCRFAREECQYSEMPIVVVSAKGLELNQSDFQRRWNIEEIVFKPFSVTMLTATVKRILEKTEGALAGA